MTARLAGSVHGVVVQIGPELDYVLVEGPVQANGTRLWLVLAEALAEKALARYGVTDHVVHARAGSPSERQASA